MLTRLPAPLRVPSDTAHDLLRRWFPRERVLTAPVGLQREAPGRLHAVGISGGAVYDGLIALIVEEHRERLLTFDQRPSAPTKRSGSTSSSSSRRRRRQHQLQVSLGADSGVPFGSTGSGHGSG